MTRPMATVTGPAPENAPSAAASVPWGKQLRRAVRYRLIRLLLTLAAFLPLEWASALGRRLGKWGYWFSGRDRRWALQSLATAFPQASAAERTRLAQRCFQHLGAAALELACVDQLDAQLDQRVEWAPEDRAVLDSALAEGRGVLFISGHVGNWELLARRIALAGYPSQSIAKETSDPQLTQFVERFRQKGKVGSIWRGNPGAVRQMLRALKAGEILGMLIDQDTKVQSVFVPFFGQLAKTPRAAADLALRTQAPVVMGFCTRVGDGLHYQLTLRRLPPISPSGDREADALALTAAMSSEIEQAIRRSPEQWVWMHRRWKSRP